MKELNRETIDKAFKNLAILKMQVSELENQVDMWQGAIKDYMEKTGLQELQGTEHRATYKSVSTSRIDKKALTADLPEIAEKYSRTTETMRFNFI